MASPMRSAATRLLTWSSSISESSPQSLFGGCGGGLGFDLLGRDQLAHALHESLRERGLLLAEDELRRQERVAALDLARRQCGQAKPFRAALSRLLARKSDAGQRSFEVRVQA